MILLRYDVIYGSDFISGRECTVPQRNLKTCHLTSLSFTPFWVLAALFILSLFTSPLCLVHVYHVDAFFVHVHSPTIAKIIAILLLCQVIIERTLGSSFIVTVI